MIMVMLSALTLSAQSQGDKEHTMVTGSVQPEPGVMVSDSVRTSYDEDGVAISEDALHLPLLTEYGTVPHYGLPMSWRGGWASCWDLHQGLNVSLGASVFSTFGSGNTWSGAGFSQNVSMMYALPLNNRWSLAVGGYFTNATWAHNSFQEVGLTGILDYRINDRWDAFLYGQKTIVQSNNIPLPLYDMGDIGDRIGIGLKYKITPAISVEMRVEESFAKDNHSISTGIPRTKPLRQNSFGNSVPTAIDNAKGNY